MMDITTQKLNILFIISKSRMRKDKKVPIYCRLTYMGKRKPFATGLFIKPEQWNNAKQCVEPPNEENNFINAELSLIKNKINQAFLFLQLQAKRVDVEQIYLQYVGKPLLEEKTLLEALNYHNNRMKKLIGVETVLTSWKKYDQTQKHVLAYVWHKFKKRDILLKDLNLNFLNEFEYFLKTEKKFKQTTVNKTIQRFRKIIKMAIGMDYLQKDPFMLYKVTKAKKEIVFLTPEELFELENYEFAQVRLGQVRDLFVFCCYSGLGYQEMFNLKKRNLVKGFDENTWIQMQRQKTLKPLSIPILTKTANIIDKYSEVDDTYVLPRISNQKFNSYLKEIAEIVGIDKKLTHHIARKTFATTVLLYNDVPMEIVSELLGHSKMSITQEHYGKVVNKKVSEHILKLQERLKK